ncbi:something about silencing protein 10 [Dimargaris cristalligena]|nr:something about silencing protein 10 [Dimargaris cristalligena]
MGRSSRSAKPKPRTTGDDDDESYLDNNSRAFRTEATRDAIKKWDDLSEDDIDEFHNSRDKVDFEGTSLAPAPVFNRHDPIDSERSIYQVPDSSDSDDQSDDNDMDEDIEEYNSDDTSSQTSMDKDEIFGAKETKRVDPGWGNRKSIYYQSEKPLEADEEEQDREDEEEEALRIQKLRLEAVNEDDYLIDEDDDEDADTIDLTAPQASMRARAHQAKKQSEDHLIFSSTVQVGTSSIADKQLLSSLDVLLSDEKTPASGASGDGHLIQLDQVRSSNLAALPQAEKIQILQENSPEVLELMSEFTRVRRLTSGELAPSLQRARALGITDPETYPVLTLWESEYQAAMSYLTNISFYLTLKARGKLSQAKLRAHPVVAVLVKLRQLLSKLQAVRSTLEPQVTDFLARLARKEAGEESESEESDDNQEVVAQTTGKKAKAVKSSTHKSKAVEQDMALDSESEDSGSDRDLASESTAKSSTAPKGVAYEPSLRSLQKEIQVQHRRARAMGEINATKRKLAGNDLVDMDYLDELDEDDKQASRRSLRHLVSRIGERFDRTDKRLKFTGDTDLPYKEPVQPLAGTGSQNVLNVDDNFNGGDSATGSGAEDDSEMAGGRGTNGRDSKKNASASKGNQSQFSNANDDDDDVSNTIKALEKAKKDTARQQRRDEKLAQKRELVDEVIAGERLDQGQRRKATRHILVNRGLAPRRKPENRNPRVVRRKKFEKAQKKLRSFKRVAVTPTAAYGGESTGIKAHLTRGVKF